MSSVRVLELQGDGHPRHPGLLCVENGVRLVFAMRPGPSVDLSSVVVWTNCPLSPSDAFRRHTFICLEGQVENTGDWATYIDVGLPGCFEFFLEFNHQDEAALLPPGGGGGGGGGGGEGGALSSRARLRARIPRGRGQVFVRCLGQVACESLDSVKILFSSTKESNAQCPQAPVDCIVKAALNLPNSTVLSSLLPLKAP